MSRNTLLLDCGFQPLATISWQRAVTLFTLGKVEVVEEYDRDIRSRYLVIKMPAVVRLLHMFKRHKKRVKFSRQNVLARDRWKCQYCGKKHNTGELTFDHVVPRSQGGKTEWENIVMACQDCNSKKRDRTPEQAGIALKRKPERPSWVPIFSIKLPSKKALPEEWESYVTNQMYWNSELAE